MKRVILALIALSALTVGTAALAGVSGIGGVAHNITTNLANIARLITAGSYVAGMAFVVGAIVKFKAHKDAPTQVHLGVPVAMLFIGAALIFAPTVFKAAGGTMFGGSGVSAGVSGVVSFGETQGKHS